MQSCEELEVDLNFAANKKDVVMQKLRKDTIEVNLSFIRFGYVPRG